MIRPPVHRSLHDMEPETVNPGMKRRLVWGERIMAGYLEFKQGTVVAQHAHDNEQLTYCISGRMRFTFPDGERVVRPGDVLVIPSGTPHGAEMLEDTVEMDFFSPPRRDWIDKTDEYLRR